jgi:hypothetical protein
MMTIAPQNMPAPPAPAIALYAYCKFFMFIRERLDRSYTYSDDQNDGRWCSTADSRTNLEDQQREEEYPFRVKAAVELAEGELECCFRSVKSED